VAPHNLPHAVLARISTGYPPHQGRLSTCYSPVRHSALALPKETHDLVRLACVTHAASVCPEPGSNSPCKKALRSAPQEFPLAEHGSLVSSQLHCASLSACSVPYYLRVFCRLLRHFCRTKRLTVLSRTVTRCIRCATASHSSVVKVPIPG
jgi:hypothetical protein